MKSVDWVKCSYESPYGEIVSNWNSENGSITWDISVPPNSSATVYMPGNNITEGGKTAEIAEGLRFVKYDDGYSIFRVESGAYSFELVENE